MNDWILYIAIAFVVVIIVGNFSTFNRSANKPMRKQSLNDLKETLPRTNKTRHKMPTVNKSSSQPGNSSNSTNEPSND